MLCIKNGLIHDAIHREPYTADILIDGGVITQIAPAIDVPEGTETFDASGLEVYHGFIDAHSHLGLDNYACGWEG